MNNLTLVTYTPACASGTDCGSPTRTDTACTTAAQTCDGLTFNAWEPTCNATTESCGRRNLRSVDCTRNTRTCELYLRQYRVRIETGTCDPATGCGVSTTFDSCSRSRSYCLDADRLFYYSGECGSGRCDTSIITCSYGCADGGCIIG
ncbi:MAG: hypothetical protein IT379_01615 [Deltaproteobacteria bacterium]|nr:hypothetical protein [Deltaproteobacteria bacterium]